MIADSDFTQALPGLLIILSPIIALVALLVFGVLRALVIGLGKAIGWLCSNPVETNRRAEQIAQIHYKEMRDASAINDAARQAMEAMNREVNRYR